MVGAKSHWRIAIVYLLVLVSNFAWGDNLDLWMANRETQATHKLLQNISPEGTRRGIVIASPSELYRKHWIRDAALVMDVVISLYERAGTAQEKGYYLQKLYDYVDLSKENQDNLIHRLGEALVLADGSVQNGVKWGTPQNDGPALRAITLTRLAWVLLREGKEGFVREKLYRGAIPADTVIKADAEYTLHATGGSFDPWEEEFGDIFYVKMVQRRALLEAARLAERLDDGGGAQHYLARAVELKAEIEKHWEEPLKRLFCIRNYSDGVELKKEGLDSSIILGVMHGDAKDGFLPVYDDKVLSTALQLEDVFKNLYKINGNGKTGILMGRNEVDIWDGKLRSGIGHPWVLITYTFSEYYFRVAKGLNQRGNITINDTNAPFFVSLLPEKHASLTLGTRLEKGTPLFDEIIEAIWNKGDSFLERLAAHYDEENGFSEQLDREYAKPQGVKDLTWSCASAILAAWERAPIQVRKKKAA